MRGPNPRSKVRPLGKLPPTLRHDRRRHGLILARSELLNTEAATRSALDKPIATGRPIYAEVAHAVAIVVSRRGDVVRHAPGRRVKAIVAAAKLIPDAVRRPPNCNVRFAVSVIVTNGRFVIG